mgnify:FL=1|tara:strand:- start:269 stop:721 length:453 start_codon:yes stop_codon:yes gene_type:complete
MYTVNCKTCNKEFETINPRYMCCSAQCGKINKVLTRYIKENGNWDMYFKHLLSKKEGDLTSLDLIKILDKQDGKCALSGEELTCTRIRGEVSRTNASIDRINAGEEYNVDNVQLVCRAVNSFRNNLTVADFINWCKKVAKHGIHKEKKTL